MNECLLIMYGQIEFNENLRTLGNQTADKKKVKG